MTRDARGWGLDSRCNKAKASRVDIKAGTPDSCSPIAFWIQTAVQGGMGCSSNHWHKQTVVVGAEAGWRLRHFGGMKPFHPVQEA